MNIERTSLEVETAIETEKIEKGIKWSTSKFAIGLAKLVFNLSTVAWGVYTYYVQIILRKVFAATNGDLITYLTSPVMIILVAGWVIITFITACNLQKAFSTMIENAKLNAELKAIADFKGTADMAQIINAIKGGKE